MINIPQDELVMTKSKGTKTTNSNNHIPKQKKIKEKEEFINDNRSISKTKSKSSSNNNTYNSSSINKQKESSSSSSSPTSTRSGTKKGRKSGRGKKSGKDKGNNDYDLDSVSLVGEELLESDNSVLYNEVLIVDDDCIIVGDTEEDCNTAVSDSQKSYIPFIKMEMNDDNNDKDKDDDDDDDDITNAELYTQPLKKQKLENNTNKEIVNNKNNSYGSKDRKEKDNKSKSNANNNKSSDNDNYNSSNDNDSDSSSNDSSDNSNSDDNNDNNNNNFNKDKNDKTNDKNDNNDKNSQNKYKEMKVDQVKEEEVEEKEYVDKDYEDDDDYEDDVIDARLLDAEVLYNSDEDKIPNDAEYDEDTDYLNMSNANDDHHSQSETDEYYERVKAEIPEYLGPLVTSSAHNQESNEFFIQRDQLVFDPYKLEQSEIERFLSEARKIFTKTSEEIKWIGITDQNVTVNRIPDESLLKILHDYNYSVDDALASIDFTTYQNTTPCLIDHLNQTWSTKDKEIFKNNFRSTGTIDLNRLHLSLVNKSRSDVLEYYYHWKTTQEYRSIKRKIISNTYRYERDLLNIYKKKNQSVTTTFSIFTELDSGN
ncbi:hypothetical protein PPL_03055 [Heterostelium album PN500]|uniref:ELM2 domain-containing protein n=1 Tax=Heterostelium pallidum (strain ATCC 26659 / Pp 5 / PN500) TaxID=670386 RepID=D3B3T4_HETP5|nr:hypothetical protein PPL_03055 [Heterostelium album PN500]EFA83982.1 hypothetical protein PPL_03055 [Heterostelium album PN500]|eukprot:XP_020436099.1 hypothetical protein PPL_03055 [Heterostelium album PN500]